MAVAHNIAFSLNGARAMSRPRRAGAAGSTQRGASTTCSTGARASSPAASGSGWRSRAPSSPSRRRFLGSPGMNCCPSPRTSCSASVPHLHPATDGVLSAGAARWFDYQVTRLEYLGADRLMYGTVDDYQGNTRLTLGPATQQGDHGAGRRQHLPTRGDTRAPVSTVSAANGWRATTRTAPRPGRYPSHRSRLEPRSRTAASASAPHQCRVSGWRLQRCARPATHSAAVGPATVPSCWAAVPAP